MNSTLNKELRKDFPIFSASENEGLVYFDSAATSQRPQCVIDAVSDFYKKNNANPLRGLYDLSQRATDDYENARATVAKFINAKQSEEIIFTRNATESLNLIAYTYGMQNVNEGDEIVVSIMEHHSNILPWQMVCNAKKAKLVWLECDKNTGIIPESEYSKINSKTKIVAITYVSNVLGTTNPVKQIAEIAHKNNAILMNQIKIIDALATEEKNVQLQKQALARLNQSYNELLTKYDKLKDDYKETSEQNRLLNIFFKDYHTHIVNESTELIAYLSSVLESYFKLPAHKKNNMVINNKTKVELLNTIMEYQKKITTYKGKING